MPKPQMKRTDAFQASSPSDDYAPKKYSAKEHAAMGAKALFLICALFVLLWGLNAIAVK